MNGNSLIVMTIWKYGNQVVPTVRRVFPPIHREAAVTLQESLMERYAEEIQVGLLSVHVLVAQR